MKISELYNYAPIEFMSAADLVFALAHKKVNPLAKKEGIGIAEQMLYANRRGYNEREAVEHIADALVRFHSIKPEFHEDVAAGIGRAIVKVLRLGQCLGEYPGDVEEKGAHK